EVRPDESVSRESEHHAGLGLFARDENHAADQCQRANDRRERHHVLLFLCRLNRPHVDALLTRGIGEPAPRPTNHAHHGQNDADRFVHVASPTSGMQKVQEWGRDRRAHREELPLADERQSVDCASNSLPERASKRKRDAWWWPRTCYLDVRGGDYDSTGRR